MSLLFSLTNWNSLNLTHTHTYINTIHNTYTHIYLFIDRQSYRRIMIDLQLLPNTTVTLLLKKCERKNKII